MSFKGSVLQVLSWVCLVLSLFYYVALDVAIGIEQMWVPFGLSIGATVTCALYLLFTSLYFVLDRHIGSRLRSRKSSAYAAFVARRKAEQHQQGWAAADKMDVNGPGKQNDERGLDGFLAGPTFPAGEEEDNWNEDMLSSITSDTARAEERSASSTLSSISVTASSFQSRSDAELGKNLSPSGHDRHRPKKEEKGERCRTESSDGAFVTSSGSSTSSHDQHEVKGAGGGGRAYRNAFETKNTVKHNLDSNNIQRGVWQSFTSLITDPDHSAGSAEQRRDSDELEGHHVADSVKDIRQLFDDDEGDIHKPRACGKADQAPQGAELPHTEGKMQVRRTGWQQYGRGSRHPARQQAQDAVELANIFLAIEEEESTRVMTRVALEIVPRVLIILTVLHCLLVWVSSFVVAYYTNVLFAIIPVFSCPIMWHAIAPTAALLLSVRASRTRYEQRRRARVLKETGQPPGTAAVPCACACVKVVRAMTHWAVLAAVCIVSLLLYVAAIVLPLIREDELIYEPHKKYTSAAGGSHVSGSATRISKPIVAVCYLSPLPMATLMFVGRVAGSVMRRTTKRLTDTTDASVMAGGFPHSVSSTDSGSVSIAPPNALTAGDDPRCTANPLRQPLRQGSTHAQCGFAGHLLGQRDQYASPAAEAFSAASSARTASTLSSIIRSSASVGQIHSTLIATHSNLSLVPTDVQSNPFINPGGSVVTGRGSQVHFQRLQSLSSGPSLHAHATPQLKTLTLLYIAFRDILGGDDGAGRGGHGLHAHVAKGRGGNFAEPSSRDCAGGTDSTTAARSRQQVMAAKVEALLQAVDDARYTPPLDMAVQRGRRGKENEAKAARARGNAPSNETQRSDSDAYVLTAHDDAIVLVWGLLPFSSDPVKLAVEKAERIFAQFRKNPKPYVALAGTGGRTNGQPPKYELTAAVVYSPHTLVGMLGNPNPSNPLFSFRSVHFFNPDQHTVGSALLERGFSLHRQFHTKRKPPGKGAEGRQAGKASRTAEASLSSSFSSRDFLHCNTGDYYKGILIDSRAAHAAASHILARPCGVLGEEVTNRSTNFSFFQPNAAADGGGTAEKLSNTVNSRSTAATVVGKGTAKALKLTVMYDFITFLSEREEEWHLVVQRNERLSVHFRLLLEATQSVQQNNVRSAKAILQRGIRDEMRKGAGGSEESECVEIARMYLSDIAFIELRRRLKEEEEEGLERIVTELQGGMASADAKEDTA